MQDSTQQEGKRWRVVVGVGETKKKVRLKQRHEATIEKSTCQNSASVNSHIEEEQKCRK